VLKAHQFLFNAAFLETNHCREQITEDALKGASFVFFGKTKVPRSQPHCEVMSTNTNQKEHWFSHFCDITFPMNNNKKQPFNNHTWKK